MADHQQRRPVRSVQQTLPDLVLGIDVQGRGQIVHHQQVRAAHECPGGGGSLNLSARHAHATGTDGGVQALSHPGKILFQGGDAQRFVQAIVIDSQQDGFGQGLAEQAWNLGQVGHPGRCQLGGGVNDDLPVPADLTAVQRNQPQQGAEQC